MLLADSLVWAGMKDRQAFSQKPIPVALGHDECAFKNYALEALSAAGIDWKLSCHVGSNDPIVALREADLGIAPFLAHTVPEGLEIIPMDRLPSLPPFYINMYLKPGTSGPSTLELANHIRTEFAGRYAKAA